VIRPFTPLHLASLRRHQATGAPLELESTVLVGRSPLREAVAGTWPLGDGAVGTWVLAPAGDLAAGGFVQARRRLSPSEADLVFIAPALSAAGGAALTWQRLVSAACAALAAGGVLRVYVAVDEHDRVALQVFRQLGFAPYTTDIVFRCAPGARAPDESIPVARVGPAHEAAIRQLFRAGVPEAVRATEGSTRGDWETYPLGGRAPRGVRHWVWLADDLRVLGACRLVTGRDGHWLRLVLDEAAEPGPPIRRALADAARIGPGQPVYAAARGYETKLNLGLREGGFEPVVGRFRLVKHAAARVLEPSWARRTVRGHGLDPAPSRTAPVVEAAGAPASARPHRGDAP